MKLQLIMLSQPILVNDEEIKAKEKYIDDTFQIRTCITGEGEFWIHRNNYRKIIAGIPALPSINFSALSEEDCRQLGWDESNEPDGILFHNIFSKLPEGLSVEANPRDTISKKSLERQAFKYFSIGFKAAQALNEKKFSEEDMKRAIREGLRLANGDNSEEKYIEQSMRLLSQPKVFDVEVEMEEKGGNNFTNSFNKKQIYYQQPKITNDSIKIIKVY